MARSKNSNKCYIMEVLFTFNPKNMIVDNPFCKESASRFLFVFPEKERQAKKRREIQARRRLIRRKLDPILAQRADDLRNFAVDCGIMDDVYPPPMEIKITIFTLVFLVLETETM